MKRITLLLPLILALLAASIGQASQNELVVPGGEASGYEVRLGFNDAINTLVTLSSGDIEPTTKYANQFWQDTANGLLKKRNAANDGWITMGDTTKANLGLAVLTSVQNAAYVSGTSSGGTDAYAITLSPAPAALVNGMVVVLTPDVSNTGACTLNVNGLGAKSIKKLSGGSLVDPADNELKTDAPGLLAYDATDQYWIIQGGGGASFQKARVYKAAAMALNNGSLTKITLDTISYDPYGIVSLVNSRITPSKPGYYQVNALTSLVVTAPETAGNKMLFTLIYKNGVEVFRGTQVTAYLPTNIGCYFYSSASDLIYCNGTTDYLELYAYAYCTSDPNTEAGNCWISLVGPF